MEPVTVSFAMTRDDYVGGALARLKMQTSGPYRAANRLTGIGLVVIGGILFALYFSARRPVQWFGAACVVFGAFLLFLNLPAQEFFVRRAAEAKFEQGLAGIAAHTVVFGENDVEIHSERYDAKLPYGMFHSAFADGTAILLCTAEDESRVVPERAMTADEQKRVESLLAEKMNRKFKQEGTREWTK